MKTMKTVNLKEAARAPGGVLDGFRPSRWTPDRESLQKMIEATGAKYDPNDVFFGGGFEDELLYNSDTKQWALCAEWKVVIL
jgi:hypothetical protein